MKNILGTFCKNLTSITIEITTKIMMKTKPKKFVLTKKREKQISSIYH